MVVCVGPDRDGRLGGVGQDGALSGTGADQVPRGGRRMVTTRRVWVASSYITSAAMAVPSGAIATLAMSTEPDRPATTTGLGQTVG